MSEKNCGNCHYFRNVEDAEDEDGKKLEHKIGTCNRKAPTIVDENNFAIFPVTTDDEWCGEYGPITISPIRGGRPPE